MSNKNQTIKCDVNSCKFNDKKNKLCSLDKISISCTCDNDNCHRWEETICGSFETNE